MITREKTTSTDLFSTLDEYDGLLNQLQAVTTKLVAAIDAWDSDKVESLMETRSLLCDQIGHSIETFTALAAEGSDGFGNQQSPIFLKLDEAMRNALEKHEILMEQQGEAEHRLNRELQCRRPNLAKMNERRRRHQAYRSASTSQHGRFLDSRL